MAKNHIDLLNNLKEFIDQSSFPIKIFITRDTDKNSKNNYVILYHRHVSNSAFTWENEVQKFYKHLKTYQEVLDEINNERLARTSIIRDLSLREVDSFLKTMVSLYFFENKKINEDSTIEYYIGGSSFRKVVITFDSSVVSPVNSEHYLSIETAGYNKNASFIDLYQKFYDNYRSNLNITDENSKKVLTAIETISPKLEENLENLLVSLLYEEDNSSTYALVVSKNTDSLIDILYNNQDKLETVSELLSFLYQCGITEATIIRDMNAFDAISFSVAIKVYADLYGIEKMTLLLQDYIDLEFNSRKEEIEKLYQEFLEYRNQVDFIEIYKRSKEVQTEPASLLKLTYLN